MSCLPGNYDLFKEALSKANVSEISEMQNRVIFKINSTLYDSTLPEEMKPNSTKQFWEIGEKLPFWEMVCSKQLKHDQLIEIAIILIKKKSENFKGIKYDNESFKVNMLLAQAYEIVVNNLCLNGATGTSVVQELIKNSIESYKIFKNSLDNEKGEEISKYFKNSIDKIKNNIFNFVQRAIFCQERIERLEFAIAKIKNEEIYSENSILPYCYGKLVELCHSAIDKPLNSKIFLYAPIAYNLYNAKKLEQWEAFGLTLVIKYLKNAYEPYGDTGKSNIFDSLIKYYEKVYRDNSTKYKINIKEKDFTFTPIIVMGELNSQVDNITITQELEVKKKIQSAILNPIQEQAAKGKWVNIKCFVEWGVSGYINESYLLKYVANNELKIAQSLCFEAICIGIMNSEDKNPLCARIFLEKYPAIEKNIKSKHPEYFIDGYLIKTCKSNPEGFYKKCTNTDMTDYVKDLDYNIHFQKAVIPFIEKYNYGYLNDVFIKLLYDIQDFSELKIKISGVLDSQNIKSKFGNNLTQVSDFCNIIKCYVLKKLYIYAENISRVEEFKRVILEDYKYFEDRISLFAFDNESFQENSKIIGEEFNPEN